MKRLRTNIVRESSGENVHTERRYVCVRPNHLTKFILHRNENNKYNL